MASCSVKQLYRILTRKESLWRYLNGETESYIHFPAGSSCPFPLSWLFDGRRQLFQLPDDSPSSVSSGIVESPQSTDRVEQSSADTDDSGVEAEKPSGPNGQGSMTGQEIDQPVSSTLPSESTAATSFSLSDVEPYSGSAYVAVNGNIPYFTSSELTTTSF